MQLGLYSGVAEGLDYRRSKVGVRYFAMSICPISSGGIQNAQYIGMMTAADEC